MKLALWLSLLGIITFVVGGSMLFSALGDRSGNSYAVYVLLLGAALIFVPWAAYGVSVVAFILGAYFR